MPARAPARARAPVASVGGDGDADHFVRRNRLGHAAVRAGMRAVGHARADELRQFPPWRLRHDGRLHHAHPGQPRGPAVLRRTCHRFLRHRADRRRVRAHALCACLRQEPSRPGSVHHRPRVHGGRRRRLRHGIAAGLHPDPERVTGPLRNFLRRCGPMSTAHHRRLRAAHARAAAHPLQHPLRQPAARLGRRCARRARLGHQRQRGVHVDVCRRIRSRRSRRGAGRWESRPPFAASAVIHGLLSDRGDGRRHLEHHRSLRRLAFDRHRGRRRQVLCPKIRGVRDLHHHDRPSDLASAGPVCPRRRQVGMASALVAEVGRRLATRARWRPLEYAFWLAALASLFLVPGRHLILTEIAWLALFALSLDLILGYAGIISLGHAAFFGLGSYLAALLAKHGIINEPVLALVLSGVCAAVLGFATSFLVLRGSDLTRLMVTLGVALIMREIANQIPDITGGADGLQGVVIGPILGVFQFDIFGHVAYAYCLAVLFVLFLLARRVVYSPFGLSLRAVKGNPLRAASISISVNARLVAIYTFAAFYAGIAGALLAQTTAFASLDVFSFERSADLLLVLIIGGTGYLYGGLIGAVIFKLMQDWIANLTPQYWQFWIGLVLVLIVLIGRDRIGLWTGGVRVLAERVTRRLAPGAAPVPVPPGEGS